jgi:Spy/CpxP family protein refolding chaperone
MKKHNLIISSILAGGMLTIGAAGSVHAYDGPPGGGPGYGAPGYGGPGYYEHRREEHHAQREARMAYMMNQLELDRKQREAISKIKDEEAKKTKAKMDEMLKIRDAMREQARAEKYDAAKVRELADAQAKLMSDMMVERMDTMNRIREQLTKDQEARMEQMKAKMMERRSESTEK